MIILFPQILFEIPAFSNWFYIKSWYLLILHTEYTLPICSSSCYKIENSTKWNWILAETCTWINETGELALWWVQNTCEFLDGPRYAGEALNVSQMVLQQRPSLVMVAGERERGVAWVCSQQRVCSIRQQKPYHLQASMLWSFM